MTLEEAYRVLQIENDSSEEEIRTAYRYLAKKYHPDLYIDNPLTELAEEKLKVINEAYEVLEKHFKNKEKYPLNKKQTDNQYEDIKTEKYQKYYSNSSF